MNRPSQTTITKAVHELPTWKLTTMFIFGLAGSGAIVRWFVTLDGSPSLPELIGAGVLFLVCAFFIFPRGMAAFLGKAVGWAGRLRRKT